MIIDIESCHINHTFCFSIEISGHAWAIDFNSATIASRYPVAVVALPETCTPSRPPDDPANEYKKGVPQISSSTILASSKAFSTKYGLAIVESVVPYMCYH